MFMLDETRRISSFLQLPWPSRPISIHFQGWDIVVQELPTEDVQRTADSGIHPARAWAGDSKRLSLALVKILF
jgi:hypothetical protein